VDSLKPHATPTAPRVPSSAPGADPGETVEGSKQVGPVPAKPPIGVDFMGRPFSEPVLLKIAAAYEAAEM